MRKMSHTCLNSDLHIKDLSAVKCLPSVQLKGKNWKPHELQRMCHPVVVEFAFSEVTEVFQSKPVSGALEDFLLQGDIACCYVVDNSGALAFVCKVGEARS